MLSEKYPLWRCLTLLGSCWASVQSPSPDKAQVTRSGPSSPPGLSSCMIPRSLTWAQVAFGTWEERTRAAQGSQLDSSVSSVKRGQSPLEGWGSNELRVRWGSDEIIHLEQVADYLAPRPLPALLRARGISSQWLWLTPSPRVTLEMLLPAFLEKRQKNWKENEGGCFVIESQAGETGAPVGLPCHSLLRAQMALPTRRAPAWGRVEWMWRGDWGPGKTTSSHPPPVLSPDFPSSLLWARDPGLHINKTMEFLFLFLINYIIQTLKHL